MASNLLQRGAIVITKWGNFISKCRRYYKAGQLTTWGSTSSINNIIYLRSLYQSTHHRNSHLEVFWRKEVLKHFAKSGKHLRQSLLFNKVAGLMPVTLKKKVWHRCFFVNFNYLLRTTFLQNTSGWLLLTSDPFKHLQWKLSLRK